MVLLSQGVPSLETLSVTVGILTLLYVWAAKGEQQGEFQYKGLMLMRKSTIRDLEL